MRIQNGNVFLWKGSLIENGIYQSKWEFQMKQNLVVKIGFARKWSELDPMWLVYEPCMLLGSHWGCRLICPTIIGSKSNNWTFRKAFGCAPTVTGPWRDPPWSCDRICPIIGDPASLPLPPSTNRIKLGKHCNRGIDKLGIMTREKWNVYPRSWCWGSDGTMSYRVS